MQGVSKVYLDNKAEEAKLIIKHDPAMVSVEQIIDVLKTLPTFYEGFFIPTVAEN
jgi:hypothetical protein